VKTTRQSQAKPKLKSSRAEKPSFQRVSVSDLQLLTTRLADAEETLRAIRMGEVDTVLVAGKEGSQVFTLDGAEHAYRMLIESMNEGALTLTADKMILFANQCFARMIRYPLEQVTGSSFRRFLSTEDRAILRPLMKKAARTGSQIQMSLRTGDGSLLPVQISIRELAREGSRRVIIGMVVTDLTETRRHEKRLRALTQRVVQVQEAERGRVARELHDNITQQLCAILVRSQTLANQLSANGGPAKREAIKLRELLGVAAQEVERIAHNLRPSVLDELGLAAAIRDTCTEFAERTGVAVGLARVELAARLPADTELALYRILQEALKNVELHAHARQVTVQLQQSDGAVRLTIKDDGTGVDAELPSARHKVQIGLNLLGIRERAAYVGGVLKVKSSRRAGTEIEVGIPRPTADKTLC